MIDKSKLYKFIYVSVSFADNPNFVKRLKENFEIEIPFLNMKDLNRNLKESLDSYFYIEQNEKFVDIYKAICKKYPKISFTVLGSIRGKDVFSFFNACEKANENFLKIGDIVKLVEGDFKNLSAKVSSINKEIVEIEFPLLKKAKKLTCNISELVLQDSIQQLEFGKFNNLEKKYRDKGVRNAIVIDGNDCLLRCMHNIPDKYNSKGDYIGGFMGFFFNLLKLKEIYPEYEMIVVFGNLIQNSFTEKVRNAFLRNQFWCKKLVANLGFLYAFSETEQTKNVIYSIVENLKPSYSQLIVYSTNKILQSIVTKNVVVFCPKTTLRGNSEFFDPQKVMSRYEINDPGKIIWMLGFLGDKELSLKSITDFFVDKNGPKQSKIKPAEYIAYVNSSNSVQELLDSIKKDSKLHLFVPILENNLNALAINKDGTFSITQKESLDSEVCSLLEEIEMYKEIELWDRSERIFKGLW